MRRSAARHVLLLGGYLLLAVVLNAHAWLHPLQRLAGGTGDAAQFSWMLAWTPYALTHGQNPFFTSLINHPAGVNLMWNAALPLPGALLAPVTLAVGPVLSYNLLMTLAPALSAWAAAVALRRHVVSDTGAWLGGLLYGFSPYVVAHSHGHPNLALVFFPPLLLLILDEILVRQRRSPAAGGVVLGLVGAAQLLTGEEVLLIAALGGLAMVILLVALYRHAVPPRVRHASLALGVALAAFMVVAAYPLYLQLFGPQRVTGLVQPTGVYVSDALSFVAPSSFQVLAPDASIRLNGRFTGGDSELNSYLGLPLVAVMVFTAFRHWREPAVRLAALLASIFAVLSLGPHLHVGGRLTPVPLPFLPATRVPLLGDVLANRLMVVVFLAAGLILARFVQAVAAVQGRRRVLGAVAVAVVTLSLVPRALPVSGDDTPPFFASPSARLRAAGVVLVAPLPSDGLTAGAMLWQARSDMAFRTPAGYFVGSNLEGVAVLGGRPSRLAAVARRLAETYQPPPPSEAEVRDSRDELGRSGATLLVLGPARNQARLRDFFERVVGRAPDRDGGVDAWWLSAGGG